MNLSLLLVAVAAAAAVALVQALVKWYGIVKKCPRNTGPTPWPLLGNIPGLLYYTPQVEEYIELLVKKYGRMFEMWVGSLRVVYCGEPEMVKKVLSKDAESFPKAKWEKWVLFPVMEGGIILAAGEEWKHQHRVLNTFFLNGDIYRTLADTTVTVMKNLWYRERSPQEVIPVHQECRKVVIEVMMNASFGTSLLEKDAVATLEEMAGHFTVLSYELEERGKDFLKLRPFVNPITVWKATKLFSTIHQNMVEQLKKCRKAFEEGQGKAEGGKQLLVNSLLKEPSFSDVDGAHQLMTLFAASETTTHLLTWSLYALSQHPEVEQKLRSEIREVLGEREPTFDDISKFKYAEAFIHETLRLYPPAPAMFRQPPTDQTLGTVEVPAGSIVLLSPWMLHRDPQYWENPLSFEPERFLKDNGAAMNNPAFMPFGNGKRLCIGKKFSLVESTIAIVMLVRAFHFSLVPGQKIVPQMDVLTHPRFGLKMTQQRVH